MRMKGRREGGAKAGMGKNEDWCLGKFGVAWSALISWVHVLESCLRNAAALVLLVSIDHLPYTR